MKEEDVEEEDVAAFCPYCGQKVGSDFNFCPRCGKKLPDGG
ncbi:MAG: zinc ribbon domain-containing protein [Firmicutes bacterium]|nr:zinc ribbon domain-containing protein [Candidatus Fermentithermobacillaceae bacterium]